MVRILKTMMLIVGDNTIRFSLISDLLLCVRYLWLLLALVLMVFLTSLSRWSFHWLRRHIFLPPFLFIKAQHQISSYHLDTFHIHKKINNVLYIYYKAFLCIQAQHNPSPSFFLKSCAQCCWC